MAILVSGTMPSATSWTPYTYYGVNLNASVGPIGEKLWSNTLTAPAGNITVSYSGPSSAYHNLRLLRPILQGNNAVRRLQHVNGQANLGPSRRPKPTTTNVLQQRIQQRRQRSWRSRSIRKHLLLRLRRNNVLLQTSQQEIYCGPMETADRETAQTAALKDPETIRPQFSQSATE